MRPGPSRCCASTNPDPSTPIRFETGTRTSRYTISAWLPKRPYGVCGSSMVDTSRTMSTPGADTGTMIMDEPEYGCTSGLVTAITIKKSATDPLEVNHLCPLIPPSSPSRTADVFNSVGSDPAVSGSVMEKADRNSPSNSGCNHSTRCASFPEASIPTPSDSAFPESGALLPNTPGAYGDWPKISCISPNFTCPNP